MSNSPTITGTITGGIQDISALLPLLGTEQCERHVGSALDAGYLYSAVTPISIFGSLGIVRASFNILVASFSIQYFQFLGARPLFNSGFSLSGTVASMIALDPEHPKRFLAETRLETMLEDDRFTGVSEVMLGEGLLRWNFMLVVFTLVISLAGLLPYIAIILHSSDAAPEDLFPLGFGFPILRVFGSVVCVIVAQFLIQIRILAILKARSLFMKIYQQTPSNVEFMIGTHPMVIDAWAPEFASEHCLWALQKWLATSDKTETTNFMAEIYASEYKKSGAHALIRPWITLLLCFGLAIGCISLVVGYVGSFYLIQHSTSSNGPLLWLLLEAVLSVFRIVVWATNPSWDDCQGIIVKFTSSPTLSSTEFLSVSFLSYSPLRSFQEIPADLLGHIVAAPSIYPDPVAQDLFRSCDEIELTVSVASKDLQPAMTGHVQEAEEQEQGPQLALMA